MMGSFHYRGTSSLDYGLMVATEPKIPTAQRGEEQVSVPGRDGVLRIDHGRFLPITVSYECGVKLFKRNGVERLMRGIKAWLVSGRGDYILSDSYDTDYFRIASFSGPMDIENTFDRGGKFTVSFLCHPYKYSHGGQFKTTIGATKTLVNIEPFESLPYIRINGNGSCELYLNNTTIGVSDVSEYVEIDSEAKQVFKGAVSMNGKTVMGDFPVLAPGKNDFDWNSNVTSVEIIPRWRTL